MSDYDDWVEIKKEAEGTIDFTKRIYPTLGGRDFFQRATLRLLIVILKILVYNRRV